MKTQKHFISRLLSLALVFLLALTMAVPAFAADTYTITIKNAQGLPAMQNDQFTAYQIFKGTAHEDTITAGSNDWGAQEWNNWSLADIQWGNGVKAADLITALKALTSESDESTWPEFFKDGNNIFKDVPAGATDASAEAVANILVANNNNAFLQAFSEFVVHGKDNRGQGTGTGYVQSGTKSQVSAGSGTADNGADDESTITVSEQGYYLIAEDHAKTNGGTESEFILAVLGNQTINLKAYIPDVEKDIVKGEDDTAKGDAAGVGDTVKFNLTGEVVKNIDIYNKYEYKFTDTLSKGLTYQKDAKVYLKRGGKTYEINTQNYTVTPANVQGPITELPTADTTITITFTDLKNISVTGLDDFKGILGTDEIVVEYTAVLNENAVIGSTGNLNTVTLQYSNDPHSDSKGTTESKKNYVYSFGLDLKKVGSDEQHSTGLAGASFVLKKGEPENVQYAKFKDQWIVTKEGQQTFYNSSEEAEAAKGDGTVTGPVRRLTEWVNKETFDSATDGKESSYYLTSTSDGTIPDVYGLDEGTYTLQEVVTPAGYNTMEDFAFTITATFNESTGELTSVKYTSPNAAESGKTYPGTDGQGVFSSGLLPETLTNQKAPLLPFTGGTGTVIFYVLGGLFVAGAVTYLVIASKKRKKTEENA